jgi:5'(3')-deoxyribonucleotidase
MKPRVLFDIDGVFADFITPCLQTVFEHTGKRFTHDDVQYWDIMKSLAIEPDMARAIYKAMEKPGLCLGIPVYEGAREGVERVREFAEVWAVTSPFGGEHWMHERDQWLVEKMGFHKDDVLHVRSKRKHGVFGDILVEDKTETLVTWANAWPKSQGILFRRAYNERDLWEGMSSHTWPGIVQAIESVLL